MERSNHLCGGGTRSATRSTSAASPTATATGSATCPGSPRGCPTCATSVSTRSGSRRSTPRRRTTTGTTWPTTATSTRCSARSPTPTTLLARAHELGLRVIVDIVPNHTSDQHAWFQAALAAGPGSPERERYLFRDADPIDPELPAEQLEVRLRRPGVDASRRTASGTSTSSTPPSPTSTGATPRSATCSRTSCASGSTAASTASGSTSPTASTRRPSLRDQVLPREGPAEPAHRRGQHGRAPPGRRRADVGPARGARGLPPLAQGARGVRRRPDGRGRGLDVDARSRWPPTSAPTSSTRRSTSPGCSPRGRPPAFAKVITGTLDGRRAGRRLPHLGAEQPRRHPPRDAVRRRRARAGPRPGGHAGDAGAARARRTSTRARSSASSRPTSRPEFRQDPSWFRTGEEGRDGCRVPIPWGGTQPPYGFGPGSGQPWIPQPDDWAPLTRRGPAGRPGARRWRSTARRWPRGARTPTRRARRSSCSSSATDVLAFRARPAHGASSTAARSPVPLPEGEVVVASGPLTATASCPPDTAVWLALSRAVRRQSSAAL